MLRKDDERISLMISGERTEEYDGRIAGMDSWSLFYHLSILRHSLLNWYDFRENAAVLEVGSGFGALTGLLLDRAARVDAVEMDPVRADSLSVRFHDRKNLRVFCKEIDAYLDEAGDRAGTYDYIVLVDFLEEYAGDAGRLLTRLKSFLSEGGKLLLGIRNRNGVKYEAGASDEFRVTPMSEAPYLTKTEAGALLASAGFSTVKWYYPLPDLSVVHAVYTDAYLPSGSLRDRVICYDAQSAEVTADAGLLLEKAAEEGRIPEAANAYLIEAGYGTPGPVIYAAPSTDRGREHGFATVLYEDGTAVKRPLWPDGTPALRRSLENAEKLKARGIQVVDQAPEEKDGVLSIRMPLMRAPSAAAYLKENAGDRERILEVLDCFRKDISVSSKEVQLTDAEAGREWGWPARDLGPVLAEGYIDMIPYNSFFENGRLLYFDQEFVRKLCPVGYIMYRVLRYMWQYAPETRKTIPPEELKARYGITRTWQVFEQAEDLFTYGSRNCRLYRRFFAWADVSPEGIRQRAGQRDEGTSRDPDGEEKRKKVRAVELDLLRVTDEICRKHHLRYTALYGTLLGAVRHQGFIPWDDDIDLGMPRKDYDAFVKAAREELAAPYFLQTPESDPLFFSGGYARLRNSRTTAREAREKGRASNQGIWIEIYPLDDCGRTDEERNRQQRKVFFAQRLLFAKIYPLWSGVLSDSDPKKVSLYYILADKMSHAFLCRLLHKVLTGHKKTGEMTVFATYYRWRKNWNRFSENDFDHLRRIPFEDTEIPVPEEYDRWLRERYGENYMEYPPPAVRKGRHGKVEFDPDHAYNEKEVTV